MDAANNEQRIDMTVAEASSPPPQQPSPPPTSTSGGGGGGGGSMDWMFALALFVLLAAVRRWRPESAAQDHH